MLHLLSAKLLWLFTTKLRVGGNPLGLADKVQPPSNFLYHQVDTPWGADPSLLVRSLTLPKVPKESLAGVLFVGL